MQWTPGAFVGDYQLIEQLGAGGCGVVFRARHRTTGGEVALKTLLPGAEFEDRVRFQREGEAMARLNHPNLLRVHGLTAFAGHPILIAELARESLDDLLTREGPMAWPRAVEVIQGLAAGLQVAHQAGVLHRDLKPQNVLFGDDGLAKLADFGLAQIDDRSRMTQTGAVMGTPAYMAPEQATGTFSPASDLYGLGALLFACLTGRPPLGDSGSVLQMLVRVQEVVPPALCSLVPDAPLALETLLAKALAKQPAARPTVAAFLARLGELEDEPLTSWLPLLAVVTLLLASAGVIGFVLSLRGQGVEPPPPREQPSTVVAGGDLSRLPKERRALVIDARTQLRAALLADEAQALEEMNQPQLAGLADQLEGDVWDWYAALHDPAVSKQEAAALCLRLAREGHLKPLLDLLRPAVNGEASRRLKRLVAALGDENGFQGLSRDLLMEAESEKGETTAKEARTLFRYLAATSQLHTDPLAILEDLKDDGIQDAFPHLGAAWVALWESERAELGRGPWSRARGEFARGNAAAALDFFLKALDVEDSADHEQILAELRRTAEALWSTELLALGMPKAGGYPLPRPVGMDYESLRAQANTVLARTRWARGHLLRALIDMGLRQHSGLEGDQAPVIADLCQAIALWPDFEQAHKILARLGAIYHPLLGVLVSTRFVALKNPGPQSSERISRVVYLERALRFAPGVMPVGEVRSALAELTPADWSREAHEALKRERHWDRGGGREGTLSFELQALLAKVPRWNEPRLVEAARAVAESKGRARTAYERLRSTADEKVARATALGLAQRGHLTGLYQLVVRTPMGPKTYELLLYQVGFLGEPRAFGILGGFLEQRAVGGGAAARQLARALRMIALASDLGWRARDLRDRIRGRGFLKDFSRLELAWFALWEARHDLSDQQDPQWGHARGLLRDGKLRSAVEGYLAALQGAHGPRHARLLRELRFTAQQYWTEQAALHAPELAIGYAREEASRDPLDELLAQMHRVFARVPWADGYALSAVLRWKRGDANALILADLQRSVQLRPDFEFAYRHWNQIAPTDNAEIAYDRVLNFLALTAHRERQGAGTQLELCWARRRVHDGDRSNLSAADCVRGEAKLDPNQRWSGVDATRFAELQERREFCRQRHPECAAAYRDK